MVRTEDIEAEFEVQLMRISDPSIRKKVVEAWSKASQGGDRHACNYKSSKPLRQ